MAIKIRGIIGWDVVGGEFADRLSRLDGDVTFEIDSPGGSVFHGITIYNAIKNYNRGKKTVRVTGDASSMAAYIMLAGDGLPIFEPNAVSVLHNPWTVASGDYNAFKKQADILERLAALYAKAFVEKGLFEEKEIRQIMDEETWFIGAEQLKKLGTIAGDSDKKEDEDSTIAMEACRQRMKEAQAKIREINLPEESSLQIAALIKPQINAQTSKLDESNPQTQPTQGQKFENKDSTSAKKGEKQMETLQDLKAEKPSIYEAAIKAGRDEEQKRVKTLLGFIDTDKDAVIKAITEGKSVVDEEFQAAILQARINGSTLQQMQDSNPKALDPKAETHEPEGGEGGEKTDEQKQKEKEDAEAKQLEDILAIMESKRI